MSDQKNSADSWVRTASGLVQGVGQTLKSEMDKKNLKGKVEKTTDELLRLMDDLGLKGRAAELSGKALGGLQRLPVLIQKLGGAVHERLDQQDQLILELQGRVKELEGEVRRHETRWTELNRSQVSDNNRPE